MENIKVDSMKKVSLLFEAGTTPERMDLTSNPAEYAFILGTGPDGLTPFEYEIANKFIGDEVVIPLKQTEISSKFEHMAQFVKDNVNGRDIFYLKVKIVGITDVDNREIVEALAKNVTQGHSCDCGCGCGG